MDRPVIRQIGYALIVVLAFLPPLFLALDEPFYLDVVARMMIFGIAALSLDLILGYAGLISLGHAVYLGMRVRGRYPELLWNNRRPRAVRGRGAVLGARRPHHRRGFFAHERRFLPYDHAGI
jgi:hypothetical protein